MEREVVKQFHPHGGGEGSSGAAAETTTTEFLLQWGNRKRLRCMKFQVKDDSAADKTTVRGGKRVLRSDKDPSTSTATVATVAITTTADNRNNLNLRQHPPSSTSPHRILRSSETMREGMRSSSSPETGAGGGEGGEKAKDTKATNNNHHHQNPNGNSNGSPSSETAKGGGGGSTSGSEAIQAWPPKLEIGLSNKEKEEDFMAIKGSKLPLRPKKRAKFIQRSLSLVSPGSWLCDLTLDRYEVREKKITKKKAKGLKALVNMDSDSE